MSLSEIRDGSLGPTFKCFDVPLCPECVIAIWTAPSARSFCNVRHPSESVATQRRHVDVVSELLLDFAHELLQRDVAQHLRGDPALGHAVQEGLVGPFAD